MQLDQSLSQSYCSRDAYRKYSIESDFESQDDKDSNRFIQEASIDPFCLSQYALLNAEQNLKLLQHIQTQSLVFERLCTYQNNHFSLVEEEINKRKEMNGKYNLVLYDYSMIPGKNQFNIFYEAFAQGLNKEFINHVKQNLRWRERELINTMKCVLKGLKELHDKEIIHGDLRMSNIVLTEQGEVKLADQYCINFSKIDTTSYYKKDVRMLIATHSLFPPESMQFLKDKQNIDTSPIDSQNTYDQVITKNSDLWALGIILLEMVLLENVHKQIYDFNNFEIRINLLKQKIKKVKSIFPRKSIVINLINYLLSDSPDQRQEAFDHIKNSYQVRKSVSFKESPKNSSISNNSFSKIEESEQSNLGLNSEVNTSQASIQHSNFIQEPIQSDQSFVYTKNVNLNNQFPDILITKSLTNFNYDLHSQTNKQRDSISQNYLIFQNEIPQQQTQIIYVEPKNDLIYQSEPVNQNQSIYQNQLIYQNKSAQLNEPIYQNQPIYLIEQIYENEQYFQGNNNENKDLISQNVQTKQNEIVDQNFLIYQNEVINQNDSELQQICDNNIISQINQDEESTNENIYSLEQQQNSMVSSKQKINPDYNQQETSVQNNNNQQNANEIPLSMSEQQAQINILDQECVFEQQNDQVQSCISQNQITKENKANEVQYEIEQIYEENELQDNMLINQKQLSESYIQQENKRDQSDLEKSNSPFKEQNLIDDEDCMKKETNNVINQSIDFYHNIISNVIEQPIRNNLFESNVEEDKKDSITEMQQCLNDDCLVIYNYDNLLQDSDISSISSLNNSQQINQIQQKYLFNNDEKENIQNFSNEYIQQGNDYKLNQISCNSKNQKQYQQQLLQNIFDFKLNLMNKQKKQYDQFDYQYEYENPHSKNIQVKKDSDQNNQKQSSSRNQEFVLFPSNKQQYSKQNNIVNIEQQQRIQEKQNIQNIQNNLIKDEYDQNNQNQKGIFLLYNYEQKIPLCQSQIINSVPIIPDNNKLSQNNKGNFIKNNQNNGTTDYFNQISPIVNGGSRLTNQSISITEWMKESCIQNGLSQINTNRAQYEQQIKIDEKIQKLDQLCNQALTKSQKNREKIELITSSIKKKREQIYEEDQQNKSIELDEQNQNYLSTQQVPDLKSYSIIDQLHYINQKTSPSASSLSSVSNCDRQNNIENNMNEKYNQQLSNNIISQCQKKNTLLQQLDAQIKQENEYSQQQNLKLSAHYGSLALNHLVEYIEQQKRQQTQDIQRKLIQNNDQQQFNTKILNHLFKNENEINQQNNCYFQQTPQLQNPYQINTNYNYNSMNTQLNTNKNVLQNITNETQKEQNFKGILLLQNQQFTKDNKVYLNSNQYQNQQVYEIKTPTTKHNNININKLQQLTKAQN